MKPLHIETPLFESRPLSIQAGRSVWLKFDALQPPGSFKIRGIGHACQEYVRRGAKRLISSSGGNAGIAVAYAGRHLSVPVLIVVPETTSELARASSGAKAPRSSSTAIPGRKRMNWPRRRSGSPTCWSIRSTTRLSGRGTPP